MLAKLGWMREAGIWPNGLRYLWTDAFGVVLLVSLHEQLGKDAYIDEAQWLVTEVDRVLGGRAESASARSPTATASISITLPSGSMRSRRWPGTSRVAGIRAWSLCGGFTMLLFCRAEGCFGRCRRI